MSENHVSGMEASAVSVLKRAVELDQSGRFQESLVCYQEGIQLLIDVLKGIIYLFNLSDTAWKTLVAIVNMPLSYKQLSKMTQREDTTGRRSRATWTEQSKSKLMWTRWKKVLYFKSPGTASVQKNDKLVVNNLQPTVFLLFTVLYFTHSIFYTCICFGEQVANLHQGSS